MVLDNLARRIEVEANPRAVKTGRCNLKGIFGTCPEKAEELKRLLDANLPSIVEVESPDSEDWEVSDRIVRKRLEDLDYL